MTHKNSLDVRRKSRGSCGNINGELKNGHADNDRNSESYADSKKDDDVEEIKGRFVGVDETDTAIKLNKVHVLKTRSSSEQNLMMKTSTLRKGVKYLSSTTPFCENNNVQEDKQEGNDTTKDIVNNKTDLPKQIEINVTVSIDSLSDVGNNNNNMNNNTELKTVNNNNVDDTNNNSKDICELIKAVSNASLYKKNSNVYSVFQAKTLLSERRRSVPMIPKLMGQKSHENDKVLSKSLDDNVITHQSLHKDLKAKTFRTLSKGFGRLLRRHSSVNISEPDPVFKVAYLGNVLTGWAKGDGCVDKPLGTLWKNYSQSSKPDVVMKLSITSSGLKGITKEHGLTEYWAHRITYCCSPSEFPKVFCWVYRHEGRKLKHELRCHAVLCAKDSIAKKIAMELQIKIKQALFEFKRDKISRQNARLSLANAVYDNPSLPRRKILLSVGGNNYKPPLERSKSAPKLMAIEEMCSEEDEEEELPPKKPEMSTNTWTKEMSTQKMCCKVEDYFPSYTLGRRKCDKRCLKKLTFKLKDDLIPAMNDNDTIKAESSEVTGDNKQNPDISCVNNSSDSDRDTCDEKISSQKLSNHVSFNFSSNSEVCESDVEVKRKFSDPLTDTDDEVFYCETDDSSKNKTNHNSDGGSQTNYIVLDSDEGSISSGCETASTVTSSDIEMTSLPCNYNQNDFNKNSEEAEERMSVLERVQSFEQLFNRERNHSVRNFRSCLRRNISGSMNNKLSIHQPPRTAITNIDTNSTNTDDSIPYSMTPESEPNSYIGEVNLVPLGESESCPRSYLRCQTYLSDDEANPSSFESHDFESNEGRDVCGELEKDNIYQRDVMKIGDEKPEEDSDSACSVESGYSEYLGNEQNDCIISQTVMV